MTSLPTTFLTLTLLLGLAFVLNLPLGRWRARCPRYSLCWFLAIHLSIPVLLALRLHFDLGWPVVPFSLGCAVLGQWLGARWATRGTRPSP